MTNRLQQLIRLSDPAQNPFMSRERAELAREMARRAETPLDIADWGVKWGLELLNAGQTSEAIQVLDRVAKAFKANEGSAETQTYASVRMLQAIAFLRLAEQENCLSNHTAQSCLFPIQEAGVHKSQRGSRAAIQILSEEVKRPQNRSRAQWLLNLAHMTIGGFPDKVPSEWRLDPKLFASERDIKRFRDIAPELGLNVNDLAGGSIAEDFDGDGYLDIMASSMALQGQLRLFRNNADGTFTERTDAAGLTGQVGGLNIVQTDYNNDGHPDVLVLRGGWMYEGGRFPNSLLRNNGDGTFTDVTEQSKLLNFHPTQTAVWFDYNGDGWLDLFVGNESAESGVHPCELFRNNGNGTFTECAADMGVDLVGYVKGVASGDFNNDGRPDLYVSRRGQPNVLLRNDGPADARKSPKSRWKFTDVSAAAKVTEPIMSFPTWFFDYDNDGWLDLFAAGYELKDLGDMVADYTGAPHNSERPRLYRNNGDGTFTDSTKSAGLHRILHAMGCNYGDLDNDGFLDFYVGTGDPNLGTLIPNLMFRSDAGKRFQDVTASGGFGHLQKGHGVSFADFDNDGDQDIHTVIGGAYSGDVYGNAFFENPGHGNHWLVLKLEGTESNRAALGARIKVVIVTKEGERSIHRTVSPGGSFGANPLRQEIGLGQAESIRHVEIFWPKTGRTQVLKEVAMDRFYRVREDSETPTAWNLKRFKFAPGATPAHSHEAHADVQPATR